MIKMWQLIVNLKQKLIVIIYFKERKHKIPEGIKGANPNLMARSPHIKFVYDYEN